MQSIPFNKELTFEYGTPAVISPLVRRVVARNPSMFTLHGTGTYIIGRGKVAIIDPGPDLSEHVTALLQAVQNETVTDILITHTHIDHSPATRAVKAATGAKTWGFGPHGTSGDGTQVEEGADREFTPDNRIGDGDIVSGDGWTLEAIHTPGHTSNHLCLALKEENVMFSGDHVMGWSTTVISPPDGNMGDYFNSLTKVRDRCFQTIYPTHGPPVTDDASGFIQAYIDHRKAREAAIIARLEAGDKTIPQMVKTIYADVDVRLHPAACHSVLGHMIHLVEQGRVTVDGQAGINSAYDVA